MTAHTHPKLHNATWPGLVGKGDGGEPPIPLETMLDMTAAAEVNGVRFDGVDLFLSLPHTDIDTPPDGVKALADSVQARGLEIGTVIAPVWPAAGGGSAADPGEGRARFLEMVGKACRIGRQLRELGVRPGGGVRIDSATSVEDWSADPRGNQKHIAETFRQACDIAEGFGEILVAEGEICWGGMQSCQKMVELLEMTGRPATLGFQADMAHSMLYLLGYNAPGDAFLPDNFDWSDTAGLDAAYARMCAALRPWLRDFHIAQNDGSVFGSGSHDKTGRHCLPNDTNGKLDIPRHAGFWLRNDQGELTKKLRHLCWDGCMFPNATLMNPQTYNDILSAMIAVRDAHGWTE